tara:strand:- start:466 stop:975 length:510 start_codon:yes stop_codon:yes gene_type:complete
MTEEINFKAICDLTTQVLGLKKGSLALRSRKRPLQVARAVAAYIGRLEQNIHRTTIGKELNRDRSLIYHYENTHKHNYATCLVYRNSFNKVYAAFEDIDKTKKTFKDDDMLKSHLLQSGVIESKKVQVCIEVKSGESVCIIKTSYFDFSKQFENIKFAMENYHCKIKII